MIVALQALRGGVANLVDGLDRAAGGVDAKALARQDVSITLGVQVGEAVRELDFCAVQGDGAIGALALGAL